MKWPKSEIQSEESSVSFWPEAAVGKCQVPPQWRLLAPAHLGHLAFEKTIVDYRQTGSSSLPRDSILKNQRDANGLPSKASAGTAEMLMLLLV